MHYVEKSGTFYHVFGRFTNEDERTEIVTIKKTEDFDEAVALCSRLNGGDGLTLAERIFIAATASKSVNWRIDLDDQAEDLRTIANRFAEVITNK